MKMSANICAVIFFIFFPCHAYAACSVSATGINFGNYDVFLTAPLESTGSITIDCRTPPPPPNPPVDVVISIGPSPHSGGFIPRKMKHSSLSDLLNYNLFTSPSMSSIWGDGTSGTSTVIKTKVNKNDPPIVTTVYGRIPSGQDVSAGIYRDFVTATIVW